MAGLKVHSQDGKEMGTTDIGGKILSVVVSQAAVQRVRVAEETRRRQGTAKAKDRSEVAGGGKKPYRQKGTGRARQGSTRAPHWYHGGVAHGPVPREFEPKIPKKMRRKAAMSVLAARAEEGNLLVLDSLSFDAIRTKEAVKLLSAFHITGNALIITDELNRNLVLSCRNLPGIETRVAPNVSTTDLLSAEKVLVTKSALQRLEEVWA
jgi:large subunit ribosomal protein L4